MKKYSIIHIIGIVLLILTCIPIVYLLLQAFKPTETVLSNKLLFTYIRNTVLMIFVVGFFAGLLGLTLAWIISFYDFPFRRFFKVVLALPLAIPPYIAAVSYSDFMYANGLFPRLLGIFGITKHFDIMNMYGAMFIYSITLYPYVYIACLSFFKHTSASFVENARMLKANWFKLFYKVGLPLARLPLVAGLTLVIMELVSDFGVIDYYGVQGFSTGIYKIWHNYSDFYGAIRLSAIFLCVIFVVVYVESFLRRRLRYFTTSKSKSIRLIEVKNSRYILIYLSLTLLITFIIPFIQLMYNGIYAYGKLLNIKLIQVTLNTVYYTSLASLICVVISFIIANYIKGNKGMVARAISKLATMGYSIPGVLVGLAVMFTFFDVDKMLVPVYRFIGIKEKVLVLSTSVFVFMFAYVVRFMAVSFNNINAGYKKINPNLFKASSTLKQSASKTFWRVDLPLMLPTLLMSFLLVFLEILKELPITLMLKPYKLETLTGFVHTYTHNEQYSEASIYSLVIILLGMITVSLIMLFREKKYVKS